MLLTVPGDNVAMPHSRCSEHRAASVEFLHAVGADGELTNAAQPLPAPCFEDSRAGVWLFRIVTVASIATAAYQMGWTS
jgi:hypothetical protein